MFNFAWSEIALIAVVALLAIGPKDMPVAIRAVTTWIKKARRMAGEFQSHIDEMVREADLSEVRDQINELRNFDVKSMVEDTVDPDRSLRDTFASDPLAPGYSAAAGATQTAPADEAAVAELERPAETATDGATAVGADGTAPAFVPPSVGTAALSPTPAAVAPAFIPPSIAGQQRNQAAV
jgi:sec-independent protein translocase protein TatB